MKKTSKLPRHMYVVFVRTSVVYVFGKPARREWLHTRSFPTVVAARTFVQNVSNEKCKIVKYTRAERAEIRGMSTKDVSRIVAQWPEPR